jgi:hypothetical protein
LGIGNGARSFCFIFLLFLPNGVNWNWTEAQFEKGGEVAGSIKKDGKKRRKNFVCSVCHLRLDLNGK